MPFPRLILALCLAAALPCGAATSDPLLEQIRAADAAFFSAFNRCDLKQMGAMLSPDLEFYHDIAGVSDFASTMATTRANCECRFGLRRELVVESLVVHPIANFGAVQIGSHTFCHEEDGQDDCGTFEFVHLWQRTADGWKIARVISFDH